MSQQINNSSYIIHKFILFLLFIAAIFNSLGIQVQLDVVLRPTATGHGLTVVVEVSDNGLFASFISVVIDQGGTLANAGQAQRNVTYASDGWKHRPEPSRSVHLDLYGLHCIMDPELTDNGLAKALAINDIQFSTRPPQGASEPVPEFEAWVIKEASNWFASPPGAYEGVFKEKCPVERSEWCQINDKEQEELKESEEVNRIGGQSKEMVLTMVDERAYSGLPTRPHASWSLDGTNKFWTICRTLSTTLKRYIPQDVFSKPFTSLLELDGGFMTVFHEDNSQWISEWVYPMRIPTSLQPSTPIDEQLDLTRTTAFTTNFPYVQDNSTLEIASSSLFNTNFSGSPTISAPTLPALVDVVRNVDPMDWTEPEAGQHNNQQSTHPLRYWTFIGLSIYISLTALSLYLPLPPQKWVEFAFSQSPLTICRGRWVPSESPSAVDMSIAGTCESSLDKYLIKLLFGVFWRAYTSFHYLVDATLAFYGVCLGSVEDRRSNSLFEDLVNGKIIRSQGQEGVQLERFVSYPIVLRPFFGNMDRRSAKQFFAFERRQLPLAIADSIMNRYPNISIDYMSEIIAGIDEMWDSHTAPYDASQDWFNPEPEPFVQSDEGLKDILEPCTILYRPFFHVPTNTHRVIVMIINDFPLDHPDYSLCEWYDPDFQKRKHKSTIPGTTVEFTSHLFRFEEKIFFGAPSVVFDLFRAVGQDQGVRNLWMDRPANAKEAPTVPAWRGFGWYTDQSPKGNVEVPEFIFRPENYESWIMAQKIEKREYWAELAASTGIEVVKEENADVEMDMMDVEDGIYDIEMVDAEVVEVDDDGLGFLCSQLKSLNLSGPSSTS